MKFSSFSQVAAVMALALLSLPFGAIGAQTQPASSGKKTNSAVQATDIQKKARPIPFQGKIKTIDHSAKTITVGERVFRITAETRLLNRSTKTPVTLQAGVVGEAITGSYRKADDGKLIANSVYFGPKPETGSPSGPAGK